MLLISHSLPWARGFLCVLQEMTSWQGDLHSSGTFLLRRLHQTSLPHPILSRGELLLILLDHQCSQCNTHPGGYQKCKFLGSKSRGSDSVVCDKSQEPVFLINICPRCCQHDNLAQCLHMEDPANTCSGQRTEQWQIERHPVLQGQ